MEKTIIEKIHDLIKEGYGECTSVKIFANYGGITVDSIERANLTGGSMRKINGIWIDKLK